MSTYPAIVDAGYTVRHMMNPTPAAQNQFIDMAWSDGGLLARVVCHSLSQRETEIITDEVLGAMGSKPFRYLVLDLSPVTFMSSVGIGLLVQLHKRAREAKAKFIVFGLNAELLALLKMTKLDKLFTIAIDREMLAKLIS